MKAYPILIHFKKIQNFSFLKNLGARLGGTCVNVGCVPKKVNEFSFFLKKNYSGFFKKKIMITIVVIVFTVIDHHVRFF